MSFLPRTRRGVLLRALLAAVLVIGFSAGATAVAGLLKVHGLAELFKPHAENIDVALPKPGAPETLLLIGSDHRAGTPYVDANTDTMLLVRLDDNSSTINLMSVPRDLEVLGPGGSDVKLNSIYEYEGGPNALIKAMRTQIFGPTFAVNHVIDVNFTGFSDLIDAIGCVDTMVDHRYYNLSQPAPSPDNYSSIDIQPGYQKLCGGVYSPTGRNSALAFVRFRHTDSDVIRNARQQDFIRWAKDGYSTNDLLQNEGKLTKIFAEHTTTDRSLASEDGLIDLFNLLLDANKLSLKTVQFPEFFGQCDEGGATPCYVYPCPQLSTCSEGYLGTPPPVGQPTEATEAIWKQFTTPTAAPKPKPKPTSTHHRAHRAAKPDLNGLTADPGDGASQSATLGNVGLPVYYPKYIISGISSGYCFSSTGNCDDPAEPPAEYLHSYPRRYLVEGHRAYVMTLVINSALGEYYNVEGTTWQHAPILNHPAKTVKLNGRKLVEYTDGSKISLVAYHTAQAVYWVSNTLNNAIQNRAMLAIAAELTRYVPGR